MNNQERIKRIKQLKNAINQEKFRKEQITKNIKELKRAKEDLINGLIDELSKNGSSRT